MDSLYLVCFKKWIAADWKGFENWKKIQVEVKRKWYEYKTLKNIYFECNIREFLELNPSSADNKPPYSVPLHMNHCV